MANQTPSHHSPTGGALLAHVSALNSAHVEKLHELGIFDAEQLLGVIAAMGGTKELAASTGLTDQEISALVAGATSALPAHVAQQYTVAAHILRPLGALDLTDKKKAEIKSHLGSFQDRLTGLAPVTLPPNVNHIAGMEPIQNQGARGTCVGFGSTALHEYFVFVSSHAKTKLSEEYLYDFCKKIDGQPGECGTWLLDAVKILIQYGQCLEQLLSYNPNLPCNHNDAITLGMMQNGAKFRSSPTYYSNPKDVNAMKVALSVRDSNVGFCIPVYNSWYKSPAVDQTGQITMPLSGEQSVGGHCMCLVGYQDNKAYPGGGYFILRNSWGTSWAFKNPYGAGYGTIPYAYISGYCNEAASY